MGRRRVKACNTINIAAFVAGELPPAERDLAEVHLDQCPDCRRIAVSLAVPESRRHAPRLSPGDQLDQYQIESLLGSGGMGTVYAAQDRDLGRRVALKVLDVEAGSPLAGEARALARLSHPNVITVYGVGRVENATYIATEVVDGLPLQRWVATKSPSSAQLARLFVAVARALVATHTAGLVHRDVKPQNIVVSAVGVPRLIDFGLAHLAGDDNPRDTGDSTSTGATPAAGTVGYMAPEQRRGQSDRSSDQYSLCITLTEMMRLAGHRPSRKLKAAIAQGCALRAEDRFADLQPLVDALERFASRDSTRARGLAFGLTLGFSATLAVAVSVPDSPAPPGDPQISEPAGRLDATVPAPSWPPGTAERVEDRINSGDAPRAQAEAQSLLEQSTAEGDQAGQVEALRLLALALDHQNLGAEAVAAVSEGLRIAELADLPLQTERLWTHRASLAMHAGDFEAALRFADFAHFLLARRDGFDSAVAVRVLALRGEVLRRLDRLDEARDALTQAHERALLLDPAEARISGLTLSLAQMFLDSDDPSEWERGRVLLEEGFAESLDLAGSENQVAMIYASYLAKEARNRGEDEEALLWLGRALDSAQRLYGPDSPEFYRLSTNRLAIWKALPGGEFGARLLFEHYSERISALVGPDHPGVAVAQQHLGRIAMAQGRLEDAVLAYGRVLAIRERAYGADHALVTVPLAALETCNRLLGHTVLADAHSARLAKIKAQVPETGSPPPG